MWLRNLTWKITTRPPLSPVARRSPSWLNSTQEITSASVMSSLSAPLTCEKLQLVSPWPRMNKVNRCCYKCIEDPVGWERCKHNHEMQAKIRFAMFSLCQGWIWREDRQSFRFSETSEYWNSISWCWKRALLWPWGILSLREKDNAPNHECDSILVVASWALVSSSCWHDLSCIRFDLQLANDFVYYRFSQWRKKVQFHDQ